MNKLFAVLLLVVVLLVPVASAGAFPTAYTISINENWCYLPDGEGVAWLIHSPQATVRYEKPGILVATCAGTLPRSAYIPPYPTKLEYGITGRLCAVEFKDAYLSTVQYGAIVYPKGWTEISCRFGLSP